jgi:hypothetical protein
VRVGCDEGRLMKSMLKQSRGVEAPVGSDGGWLMKLMLKQS